MILWRKVFSKKRYQVKKVKVIFLSVMEFYRTRITIVKIDNSVVLISFKFYCSKLILVTVKETAHKTTKNVSVSRQQS